MQDEGSHAGGGHCACRKITKFRNTKMANGRLVDNEFLWCLDSCSYVMLCHDSICPKPARLQSRVRYPGAPASSAKGTFQTA